MSGGHWQRQCYVLETQASNHSDALMLLAGIERVLDYGISRDSCYECAKILTIEMLEAFFDNMSGTQYEITWQNLLTSENESRCDKCKERDAARGT